MAVPEQTPYQEFIANGSTNRFELNFLCKKKEHLIVKLNDAEANVGDWTFTNNAVVFLITPASGVKVSIQRRTPNKRSANYQSYNSSFSPNAVNEDFDALWMRLQEEEIAKAFLNQLIEMNYEDLDEKSKAIRLELINQLTEKTTQLNQTINSKTSQLDQKIQDKASQLQNQIIQQGVSQQQIDAYAKKMMDDIANISAGKGWTDKLVAMSDGGTLDVFAQDQLALNIKQAIKSEEFTTLEDYGAKGDGTLKTLQYWIDTGKFSGLTAIQVVYPSAEALTDSIDAVCLQDMIDKNYGKRVYIKPKHYVINKPIYIRKGISLIADQRSTAPYGYTATTAKFNFANLNSDEYALTIIGSDDDKRITGVELDGFLMFGVQTVNALRIGESLQKDVTELIVRNTVCYGFKDALTTRYLYGATFDGFRAQNCVNGLVLGAQTNQVLFNRGGVVTISNNAITMSNCEGLQFNSYNISNLTKSSGAPITLYQSQATFTNSYFENITNPILAQVGTRTEAAHIASTLILDASLKLGESGSYHDIQVANNSAYVELRGRSRFGARVVGVDASTNHVCSIVDGDNLLMTNNTFIENYPVGRWKTFLQYGGGVLAQTLHKGFIRVNNSAAQGSGLRLSEKMMAGDIYTLSYVIKKTVEEQTVSLRNGDSSPFDLTCSNVNDTDLSIYHCSFIASSENLRLLFTGDIDIYGYTLQKGNRRTTDLHSFKSPQADHRYTTEGVAKPTTTGWKTGDFVFSVNGTSLGWVCTNGTQNTWSEVGLLDAKKATGLTTNSSAADIVAALKAANIAI